MRVPFLGDEARFESVSLAEPAHALAQATSFIVDAYPKGHA
jgi:hypothetical protein